MSTGQMNNIAAQLQADLDIRIETPGLDEAIAKLQKVADFGVADTVRAKAGMQFTVSLIRAAAASKTVPFRKGRLKAAIKSEVRAAGTGDVTGKIGLLKADPLLNLIGMVLEGGRKAHEEVAYHSNRKEDRFQKRPGGRFFRKIIGYGKVASIVPRRWLWHAFSRNKEQVDAIWEKVLEDIVKDLAKKE